eukprot:300568-Chlamydomonas_euryale.AAC.1
MPLRPPPPPWPRPPKAPRTQRPRWVRRRRQQCSGCPPAAAAVRAGVGRVAPALRSMLSSCSSRGDGKAAASLRRCWGSQMWLEVNPQPCIVSVATQASVGRQSGSKHVRCRV